MKLHNYVIALVASLPSIVCAGSFTAPVPVDNKIMVDRWENTHQAGFIRKAVPGRKYNVTGTTLWIIPQENGALVSIDPKSNERFSQVQDFDPTRSNKIVTRYVNCSNYSVRRSLDSTEYVDAQPNTYSGAMAYAICHLTTEH